MDFYDLGRSDTPILSFDGSFSLYRFPTFCEKMKKIYRVEVLMQNAYLRVKVCENGDNI